MRLKLRDGRNTPSLMATRFRALRLQVKRIVRVSRILGRAIQSRIEIEVPVLLPPVLATGPSES